MLEGLVHQLLTHAKSWGRATSGEDKAKGERDAEESYDAKAESSEEDER